LSCSAHPSSSSSSSSFGRPRLSAHQQIKLVLQTITNAIDLGNPMLLSLNHGRSFFFFFFFFSTFSVCRLFMFFPFFVFFV
jgi:hypothetical protein